MSVDIARAASALRNVFGDAARVLRRANRVHDDARELAYRARVAAALISRGNALGATEPAAAIALYDEVVTRFGEATEPQLREQVAQALIGKAIIMREGGEYEAATIAYGEVVTRFGEATEPELRAWLATALLHRGMALALLYPTDSTAALAAWDEVIIRFGEATEPKLREQVAGAALSKATILRDGGDTAGAVAAYDEVVARVGNATESKLRELVGIALVNKGRMLGSTDPVSDLRLE